MTFLNWLKKRKNDIIDIILILSAFLTIFSIFPVLRYISILVFAINFFTFKRHIKACFVFFTIGCGISIFILYTNNSHNHDKEIKEMLRQGFHTEWRESSQKRINILYRSIVDYKRNNGYLPKTLEDVHKKVWINDNSYILKKGSFDRPLYYYEIVDSVNFILCGIGKDGLPKTEDDILPDTTMKYSIELEEE